MKLIKTKFIPIILIIAILISSFSYKPIKAQAAEVGLTLELLIELLIGAGVVYGGFSLREELKNTSSDIEVMSAIRDAFNDSPKYEVLVDIFDYYTTYVAPELFNTTCKYWQDELHNVVFERDDNGVISVGFPKELVQDTTQIITSYANSVSKEYSFEPDRKSVV